MERLLPRLQLVFAVLFAAISLCGPLFFAQGNLVILCAAVTGILLGVITFFIGWRMTVANTTITYPFPEWSLNIIKLFLSPKESHGLKPLNHGLSPLTRRVVGIVSMAIGVLLVAVLSIISVIVIRS